MYDIYRNPVPRSPVSGDFDARPLRQRLPAMLALAAVLLLPFAYARAQGGAPMAGLELVAEGFAHPVLLAQPDDDTGRRFVGDQTGQIYVLEPDGTLREEPFLDLSDRMVNLQESYDERGLLGLAFHPDYAENGRFFVYYSAPLRPEAPDDFDNTSHVSAFTVSAGDPNRADPASEQILLRVDEPQTNHAAGTLAFGPDGYLYVSLGDGGGGDDVGTGHVDDWYDANEGGNGQDVARNLLGSILRLDVDAPDEGLPYGIPDDNPFVGTELPAEQWAYGFRNPYRMAFDPGGDRALYVGDAGQELWEEVSIVTGGGNYGWNVKEGTHCFSTADPENPPATCPDVVGEGHPRAGDPLVDPIIEFANSKMEGGLGQVVVGGHVYRGGSLPDLDGRYLFGVWSGGRGDGGPLPGRVFAATRSDQGLWPFEEMTFANMDGNMDGLESFLLSFGQDLDGEVYVLTTDEVGPTGTTGRVYRLVAPGDVTAAEERPELPATVRLAQNYPNPFNPATTLRFELSRAAHVTLVVYDVLGRPVARLVDAAMTPGTHAVVWDGTNDAGRPVAGGTYLYRVTAGGTSDVKAMTLLE